MKIAIKTEEANFTIPIPNFLIGTAIKTAVKYSSGKSASVMSEFKGVTSLSKSERNKLICLLKDFKKRHPDLHFIEIKSGDDQVIIDL